MCECVARCLFFVCFCHFWAWLLCGVLHLLVPGVVLCDFDVLFEDDGVESLFGDRGWGFVLECNVGCGADVEAIFFARDHGVAGDVPLVLNVSFAKFSFGKSQVAVGGSKDNFDKLAFVLLGDEYRSVGPFFDANVLVV